MVLGDVLPCFDGGEGGFFGGGAGIEGSGEVIEEGRGFVPAVQQREGVGELEEAGGVVVRDFLEFGQFAFDAGDDGTGLEGEGFALGASGAELGVAGLPSGEGLALMGEELLMGPEALEAGDGFGGEVVFDEERAELEGEELE